MDDGDALEEEDYDAHFSARASFLSARHGIPRDDDDDVQLTARSLGKMSVNQLPIPSLSREKRVPPQVFHVQTPMPNVARSGAKVGPYVSSGVPVQACPRPDPVPEDPRVTRARTPGSEGSAQPRAATAAPGGRAGAGAGGGGGGAAAGAGAGAASASRPSTARLSRAGSKPRDLTMADDINKALDILEYSEMLGMSVVFDAHLLWIAEEFWLCPLPDGWEEWYTEEGNMYYHFAPDGSTQWHHPLESYYRALLFMKRSGEAELEASHREDPPTEEEVAEMCEYLGVDPGDPALVAIARQAVGAPLPPGWYEDEDSGHFVHESGTASDAHPLDVYFMHMIQVARHDAARRAAGAASAGGEEGPGGGGRKEATAAQLEAIGELLKAPKGDHFAAMGLSRGSSAAEVRRRYRALALLVHPDKCLAPEATEAFKVLTTAFKAAAGAARAA